jgi:hypothetical protein
MEKSIIKRLKLIKGNKVFDSALFGDLEGKVLGINKENPCYPISVKFGQFFEQYTIKGSCTDYGNPTLSLEPYDKLSDIVPVWEEEVWGLFWNEELNNRGETMAKIYGQMIPSGNKDCPYRRKDGSRYKNFKETGKLL